MKLISLVLAAALGIGVLGGAALNAQKSEKTTKSNKTAKKTTKTNKSKKTKVVTTKSGLKYEDLVVGKGKLAKSGDQVRVHYTGTLTNGKKFDSSLDRGEPFQFSLGAGQVIQGWDEGVAGMKVGGKRRLVIPPALGYGSQDMGPIPANSTLIFVVELLDAK